jgi:hypothetical protein
MTSRRPERTAAVRVIDADRELAEVLHDDELEEAGTR